MDSSLVLKMQGCGGNDKSGNFRSRKRLSMANSKAKNWREVAKEIRNLREQMSHFQKENNSNVSLVLPLIEEVAAAAVTSVESKHPTFKRFVSSPAAGSSAKFCHVKKHRLNLNCPWCFARPRAPSPPTPNSPLTIDEEDYESAAPFVKSICYKMGKSLKIDDCPIPAKRRRPQEDLVQLKSDLDEIKKAVSGRYQPVIESEAELIVGSILNEVVDKVLDRNEASNVSKRKERRLKILEKCRSAEVTVPPVLDHDVNDTVWKFLNSMRDDQEVVPSSVILSPASTKLQVTVDSPRPATPTPGKDYDLSLLSATTVMMSPPFRAMSAPDVATKSIQTELEVQADPPMDSSTQTDNEQIGILGRNFPPSLCNFKKLEEILTDFTKKSLKSLEVR